MKAYWTHHPDDLPAAPGTYLVWLRIAEPVRLAVGRLGAYVLGPGLYVYVGSAHGPGGLRARLRRHLRSAKARHWHIDTLTAAAPIIALWFTPSSERLECDWAQTIAQCRGIKEPVEGFGASDCACSSHLFDVPPDNLRPLWIALDRPHTEAHDAALSFSVSR